MVLLTCGSTNKNILFHERRGTYNINNICLLATHKNREKVCAYTWYIIITMYINLQIISFCS